MPENKETHEMSDEELENVAGGGCGKSEPIPLWQQWQDKARNLWGMTHYVGRPCPKCNAVSEGMYSWYSKTVMLVGENTMNPYLRHFELRCMNCNTPDIYFDPRVADAKK